MCWSSAPGGGDDEDRGGRRWPRWPGSGPVLGPAGPRRRAPRTGRGAAGRHCRRRLRTVGPPRGAPGSPVPQLPRAELRRAQRRGARDVVQALLDRGAMRTDVSVGGRGADPDAGDLSLLCRRLVYEAVVRRAVARESGVTIRTGMATVGLLDPPRQPRAPDRPRRTHRQGDDVEADLVVDRFGPAVPSGAMAGGRRRRSAVDQGAGVRVPLPHPLLPVTRRAGVAGHGHPHDHHARLRHGDGLPGRRRLVLVVEFGVD